MSRFSEYAIRTYLVHDIYPHYTLCHSSPREKHWCVCPIPHAKDRDANSNGAPWKYTPHSSVTPLNIPKTLGYWCIVHLSIHLLCVAVRTTTTCVLCVHVFRPHNVLHCAYENTFYEMLVCFKGRFFCWMHTFLPEQKACHVSRPASCAVTKVAQVQQNIDIPRESEPEGTSGHSFSLCQRSLLCSACRCWCSTGALLVLP